MGSPKKKQYQRFPVSPPLKTPPFEISSMENFTLKTCCRAVREELIQVPLSTACSVVLFVGGAQKPFFVSPQADIFDIFGGFCGCVVCSISLVFLGRRLGEGWTFFWGETIVFFFLAVFGKGGLECWHVGTGWSPDGGEEAWTGNYTDSANGQPLKLSGIPYLVGKKSLNWVSTWNYEGASYSFTMLFICIVNHIYHLLMFPYLFTSHCNVESALNHHSDVLKDRVPLVPIRFCRFCGFVRLVSKIFCLCPHICPYVRCICLAFYYTNQPNVGKRQHTSKGWVWWKNATVLVLLPRQRYPGCWWLCRLLWRPVVLLPASLAGLEFGSWFWGMFHHFYGNEPPINVHYPGWLLSLYRIYYPKYPFLHHGWPFPICMQPLLLCSFHNPCVFSATQAALSIQSHNDTNIQVCFLVFSPMAVQHDIPQSSFTRTPEKLQSLFIFVSRVEDHQFFFSNIHKSFSVLQVFQVSMNLWVLTT